MRWAPGGGRRLAFRSVPDGLTAPRICSREYVPLLATCRAIKRTGFVGENTISE